MCETCLRLLRFCEKEQSNDLPDRPGAKQLLFDFNLEKVMVPRGKLASTWEILVGMVIRVMLGH